MRFQGKIRFEDAADLDVDVEVTESHVRLVSGDESLGSWCLSDVVAHRLVANEFELDLDGEIIQFAADDQVNFAYGAVQGMAEGWARYHSMNPVSRRRAVAAARRSNEPSRLGDAQKAIVAAAPRLIEVAAAAEGQSPPEPTPGVLRRRKRVVDAAPAEIAIPEVEESITEVEENAVEEGTPAVEVGTPAVEVGTPAVEDSIPAVEVGIPEVEDSIPAVEESIPETVVEVEETEQPAPGFWDRVIEALPSSAPTVAKPEPAATEPVPAPEVEIPAGRLPRINAFPRVEEGQRHLRRHQDPDEPPVEIPVETPTEPPAEPPVERPVEPPVELPVEVPVEPPAEPAVEPQPPVEVEVDESVHEAGPSENGSAINPVSRTAWRPPDAEPVATTIATVTPQRVGAFKDGHHPAETTGLRASVKSIFGRSKVEHEHAFVESTTAVGLTRRVCLECGHVSIGVSD